MTITRIRNKRTQPLWKFYKLFESDIWGEFLKKKNVNNFLYKKFIKRFIDQNKKKDKNTDLWRINLINPKKIKKGKSLWYLTYLAALKLKLYYNNIPTTQLKNLCYKFKNDFYTKFKIFVLLLETRLDTAVYRLHIVDTMQEARQFVVHKCVTVNGKIINKLNYYLKRKDILSVRFDLRVYCLYRILEKFSKNNILYNYPVYLEVNWRLLNCSLVENNNIMFDRDCIPYISDLNINLAFEYYNI